VREVSRPSSVAMVPLRWFPDWNLIAKGTEPFIQMSGRFNKEVNNIQDLERCEQAQFSGNCSSEIRVRKRERSTTRPLLHVTPG